MTQREGRTKPAGGSTVGPFVRQSVVHPRHRRVTIQLGFLQVEYAKRTLGVIKPLTRVNPGGWNSRRGDRIRLATEGVRVERADGRCTHRVLT